MLTTETAVMLANYGNWADKTLFKAMAGLPEEAVYRKRQTLFGSMIGTLNHNLVVDLIWRAHLLGEKHGFSTRRDMLHPDLGALIEAQGEINRWYIDWAGRQNVESLDERLNFTFVSGKAAEMTRGGMFLHIVNHKTYHRGWVSEMFFDSGVNPPETDLCVFLCGAQGNRKCRAEPVPAARRSRDFAEDKPADEQMKAYFVLDLTVNDYRRFKRYIEEIPTILARHRGRYLVQGVEPSVLEGEWNHQRLVVIEFPDRAHAEALLNDPDAQQLFKLRHATTTGRLLLADGCT